MIKTTPVYKRAAIEQRLTYLNELISLCKLRGSRTNKAVGALSLVYGGAGLVQYLGFRTAPIIRALSVNAVSIVGLILGAGAILTNGLNITLLLLTLLHGIDLS
jgi:hypothetical protein